jgi:hypothetical protein
MEEYFKQNSVKPIIYLQSVGSVAAFRPTSLVASVGRTFLVMSDNTLLAH